MNKRIRTMGGFLLALALLLSMGMTAFAYTEIDTGRTGSVTVSPRGGESIGTELTLYRAADVVVDNADQKYVPTEDFADGGADLKNPDDAGALAEKLSAYAQDRNLSGVTKAVGTDGSVTFGDLPAGLYLVVQKAVQPGGSIVNPFLVSVPGLDSSGRWVYDVDASPKAETYEWIDVTVKKIWNDGGDASSRPSSITVNLYSGSTLVDAVALSSGNGWSYTWTDLEKNDGYSVSEERVTGYAASYSQSGYTFTVTNTPSLAQTGQRNWPIPALAGCGVALFAAGWSLVFLKRKDDA